MEAYTKVALTSSRSLPTSSSSYYRELTIENYSDEMMYMMDETGKMTELPPYPHPSSFERKVVINILEKNGFDTPGLPFNGKVYTSEVPKFPVTRITMSLTALTLDAVYVEEAGIAISNALHRDRLGDVHRLTKNYYLNFYRQLHEKFDQGYNTPMIINANCHDETKTHMFVGVNGLVASVVIGHDRTIPEHLTVSLNRGEKRLLAEINYDFQKGGLMVDSIKGNVWYFSTERDDVTKTIAKDRSEYVSKLSKTEVDQMIEEALAEAKGQIEALTKENEQLKAELASVRKDLALSQGELSKANNSTQLTLDQQMQFMKLQTAQEERDLLRERKSVAQEQADKKHAQDLEIAQAKVAKEHLSVQSAELGNFGTVAKTAAVIAPIAASAYIWHAKAASSVASLGVGAIAGGAGIGAIIAAAAGVAIVSSYPIFDNCCKTISDTISGLWNMVTDTVSSVVDWIFG